MSPVKEGTLALGPEDMGRDIPGDVNRFQLITVEFPAFTDGRGYTLARLLRDRLGYRGELRAVGDVQRDQFAFLRRCGFDGTENGNEETAKLWDKAGKEISIPFQNASDAQRRVAEQRADEAGPNHTRRVQRLLNRYEGQTAQDILEAAIRWEFAGQIALVSSFGAEAVVLLHMVSEIDPATPVLFLNTGKIYGETLQYRARLVERLGLQDVRDIKPSTKLLEDRDPGGVLWASDPNGCCYIRKVEPLNRALTGFGAWITGRKREHGAERSELATVEAVDGRVKINPLAGWSKDDVADYFVVHDLPRHPLEADGYLSIGCMPCTDRVTDGEATRDGRWRGSAKTECGIHLPVSNFKNYGADI
jgi:phosphoadenosine phosphosulfate reductase